MGLAVSSSGRTLDCLSTSQGSIPCTAAKRVNTVEREERLIKWREVRRLTGMSRPTVRRWEQENRFPKRKRIGLRTVVWVESEINDWIKNLGGNNDNVSR